MKITYEGMSYWDRTTPIEQGDVRHPNLELEFIARDRPGDLFRIQAQDAAIPVSEMSLSTYLMLRDRGDDRLVGLPIFPSRNFRHRDIYLRPGLDLEDPRELEASRVGVPEYQMTAALWIRGLLLDEYGVEASTLHWQVGGLRDPAYTPRLEHQAPPGVVIERIPDHRWLEEMLAVGDIDALVSVTPPPSLGSSPTEVHRLFADYPSIERRSFERSGVFPIMHLVVCRREELSAEPQLGIWIYELFKEARRLAQERLRYLSCLAVGLPWLPAHLEEIDRVFRGDAFPAGIRANESSLRTAIRYSYTQGLISREVPVEELFDPRLLRT